MMINGIMVLVLAIVVLAILWAIVLYGSTYFGPKTHEAASVREHRRRRSVGTAPAPSTYGIAGVVTPRST